MKNSPTPPGVPPAPSKPRSDLPPKLAPVSPIVGRLYTGGWSMALVRKSRLSTTDTLPELERWVVVVDVVVPVAVAVAGLIFAGHGHGHGHDYPRPSRDRSYSTLPSANFR